MTTGLYATAYWSASRALHAPTGADRQQAANTLVDIANGTAPERVRAAARRRLWSIGLGGLIAVPERSA